MMYPHYLHEDVISSSKDYFNGDELAASVWARKYALKDKDGNFLEENPDQMHHRIATEIHRIEERYPNGLSYDEIYQAIKDFKYLVPQGSPMAGIGNNEQPISLSNCFIVGNQEDSYGGIFLLDQQLAQLYKRRSGVGLDISHIRPKGLVVRNSARTSAGAASFMERFSNTTREVAQEGRRGANLLSISVLHPDAEAFIDMKMDTTKVTGSNVSVKVTDDFMEAVKNNTPFTQKWPIDSDNPKFTQEVDARKIWNKIMFNAWKSAEPGIFYWDTVIRESVPDCYADLGYKTQSTNPCLTGEMTVMVADGRGKVSIKELAEAGVDVPVYTLSDDNKVVIRTMRNPRVTGYDKQVYKITLDDGSVVRATDNHKFLTNDRDYVEVKNLKEGDSLYLMSRSLEPLFNGAGEERAGRYWKIRRGGFKTPKSEHRMVYSFNNPDVDMDTIHVHHLDNDQLNNHASNLSGMSPTEHRKHHMEGDNNPMRRIDEYDDQCHENMSKAVSGSLNGRYKGLDNDQLFEVALEFSASLNRKFSTKEWQAYCETREGLPKSFSKMRKERWPKGVSDMAYEAANHLGLDYIDLEPRTVKSFHQAQEQGYNAKIEGKTVRVEKTCENSGELFWVDYQQREISFKSVKDANMKQSSRSSWKNAQAEGINADAKLRGERNKANQMRVFTQLVFENGGSAPMMKDWEAACKSEGIPYRLKTKYGFRNFKELKESALEYNHRIVSIELDGVEEVYNGTVDDFHNFFVGLNDTINEFGEVKQLSINNLQCGEIPLSPYDSCRLLAVNLYSYVDNPFTDQAAFNWDKFKSYVSIGQRFMDDIVDLELEKVDQILAKVESDPESEDVKRVELELWQKIRKAAQNGRRTGLGITAMGDMLASLGYKYGTPEATEFATSVHNVLATEAYRSSVEMAKERGAFPIFTADREVNNPFIRRIKESDPALYEDMVKHGRRNIALLTIAPTGTTSLMTQTTSGIEPVFMVAYKRRTKINPNDEGVRVDFIDEVGDHWQEHFVFHHKFETWATTNGHNLVDIDQEELDRLIALSPYAGATANDVDWLEKVRMQGSIQKWVDHSISVTVNVPKETPESLVSEIYMTGWETGCKGMTIYRDGSRSGVLISTDEKKEEGKLVDNHAPKRGDELDAEVLHFKNGRKEWVAIVGLKDGRPYELFSGRNEKDEDGEGLNIPKGITYGKVVRVKNGANKYFLHAGDFVSSDLTKEFDPNYWNNAKLISGVLRHGMPLQYVVNLVENLKLPKNIWSWQSGVVRVIKKYVADGTAAKGSCPECKNEDLIYQEGCLSCPSCGHAKCG